MTHHEWMVGGAALAGVCAVGLAVAINRLVQIYRSSFVTAVPLRPEQAISLNATGPMVLHVEGPRLSRSFRGLKYKLAQRDAGLSVPLKSILFRTTVSRVSMARVSILSFTITSPGHYILHVEGLAPDIRAEGHRLVITRDARSRTLLTLLAIVVYGLGLISGSALSVIAYYFKSQA